LLDPIRVELRQPGHPRDRLVDAPALVRVDSDHRIGHDLLPDDPPPPPIVVDVSSHLQLEPRPALGERLAAEPPDLVVVVAQPADTPRVRGRPIPPQTRA